MVVNIMNHTEVKVVLDKVTQDIEVIADENVKKTINAMLNLIELLVAENDQLKKENQQLRDENNQLKGEQGKPSIRKQTSRNQNFSSEDDRRRNRNKEKQRRKSKKKKNRIKFDRVEYCDYNISLLPTDAVFKGYKEGLVSKICG